MPFLYQSGEEIRLGDQVRQDDMSAKVEFIVTDRTVDRAMNWYFEEYGGGVMLIGADFGRMFLGRESLLNDDGRLVFVSRGLRESPKNPP
jgi:hypothetical protein